MPNSLLLSAFTEPLNFFFYVGRSLLTSLSAITFGLLMIFFKSPQSFPFSSSLSRAQCLETMLPFWHCTSLWRLGALGCVCLWVDGAQISVVQKHKAIPCCTPFFVFYYGKLAALRTADHLGALRGLTEQDKQTDVIPIWHNCEHLQCWTNKNPFSSNSWLFECGVWVIDDHSLKRFPGCWMDYTVTFG